jgi:rhodanese-related sulfurtransferase
LDLVLRRRGRNGAPRLDRRERRLDVVETVTREELMAKINRGEDFVLVDALGPEHYESSHLPGAVNLPYEFVDEAGRVLPDKDAEIVVYCMNTGCSASKEEARELEEMGYSRVLHYAEGKQDWIRSGLRVEGGRSRART